MEFNKNYIKELLYGFHKADKNKVAFSVREETAVKEITYNKFFADISQKASYFKTNHIINQHIALIAPSSYDWMVTFFAIVATDNVAVLMNHSLPVDMIIKQCEKADVSIVCTSEKNIENLQNINDTFDVITFESINSTVDDEPFVFAKKTDDTVIMLFTSGTTGKSKAVEITDYSFQHAIKNQDNYLKLLNRERVYLSVPIFHIAGIISAVVTLHRGKTVCLGRGIVYMLSDMSDLNPTDVFFVPAMIEAIVKLLKTTNNDEERKKYLGSKLKNIGVGAASVNADTCKYLMDLGFNVEVGYAMTELTGDGTRAVLDDKHINSIGKTAGLMECRIENGELLFRGPSVMKGYYKDSEETDKVIKDGWLYTGDLGYCDEDGYFYITGRKKNVMILPNGENVSPEELEGIISDCNAVIECMVYNDNKGICIDIFTEDQETVKETIKKYNQSVPQYRQIYKVNYFNSPLEKTGTGKIKRKGNAYV